MELLPQEIICYINDSLYITDQIHFSHINKFNYKSIKINKDIMPHLLISRFHGSFGMYGNGYKLSMYIRLDQLKSYLERLESELTALRLNPPQNCRVSLWSEIYIIVLVNNIVMDERDTADVFLFMDTFDDKIIIKYNVDGERTNFSRLINKLIDIYNVKKNAKTSLPLIQDYLR